MIPWLDAGTAAWKAATGGDAIQDNVDFAEKQIKQAGIIATQDPSYDMMYTTSRLRLHPEVRRAAAAARSRRTRTPTARPRATSSTAPRPRSPRADGVLRALPLYASPAVWGWNKKLFTKIGEDPENPPDNYPDLFELRRQVQGAGSSRAIQPWLATQAILFAQLYFTYIWNSTGMPMFSPDFTQIGFDNDEGKRGLRAHRAGLQERVLGPAST